MNQHRDSAASYIGHYNLLDYFALVENESRARTKFNLLEVINSALRSPNIEMHFLLIFLFYNIISQQFKGLVFKEKVVLPSVGKTRKENLVSKGLFKGRVRKLLTMSVISLSFTLNDTSNLSHAIFSQCRFDKNFHCSTSPVQNH